MTTYFNFTPSTTVNFQFQPTLDGNVYTATINWNLFGQRYYLNLTDLSGNLVLCIAFTGSPPEYDIDLLGSLFNSTLVYRIGNGQVEVTP